MPLPPGARALTKASLLALLTIALLPFHLVLTPLGRRRVCPQLWHITACRIVGLNFEVVGEPVRDRTVVYAGNHLSHLDIPLLGSFLLASFVAKSDVKGWPVFGFLAQLQGTIFISRNPRDAAEVHETLLKALKNGDSLVIFPEGTSSAGETVLPFKSSIFAPLTHPDFADMPVQPFTIDLLSVDGRPTEAVEVRDLYAYHRDMVFAPHLWNFFKLRGATMRVVFHPPVGTEDRQDRKTLSKAAHAAVLSGMKREE